MNKLASTTATASTVPVLRYETAVNPVAREREQRARQQLRAPDACYRAAARAMPEAEALALLASWEK
ncbi:hypothetical protein [Stenotrophomonas sp. Marseille-Q4652]|uniref:hypothetical protein n=1 Tax=Stenotrophomonas sp. Marseille-Q4652 TaxID=2866595 RepID=UPI001CE40775|nr:hypothetical protein [Stenotrophomonas sp. Marseille-Q4652]